jgi:nucleoside-diphosphate-sugar epimerase
VAQGLLRAGWRVKGLARNPAEAAKRAGWVGALDWVRGDAMIESDVVAAARGAAIIFHGANPPGYKNWRGLAVPMLSHAIAAASGTGARLIFPGNVYNFGPDAGALLLENSPQHPLTRKGKVRVEMEAMLESAAAAGARTLIVRAGDFFGPHQAVSWFAGGMVTAGRRIKSVMYPGRRDAGHAWAYLPDLARAIVLLAEIEGSLPAFERVHFRGHFLSRGVEMAETVARVAGQPDLPIRPMPWWLFYVAAPFVTFMREALEMRYLWKETLQLDNAKLRRLIGEEPHTKLDRAVRETLQALGCLDPDEEPRASVDRAV